MKFKKSAIIFLFTVFSFFVLASACSHNPVGVDSMRKVCYATEVMPLIFSNCAKAGCHDGNTREGERLPLLTAADIRRHVIPGDANASRLYTALTGSGENIMPPPPASPMSESDRTIIYVWILQGADTTCTGK